LASILLRLTLTKLNRNTRVEVVHVMPTTSEREKGKKRLVVGSTTPVGRPAGKWKWRHAAVAARATVREIPGDSSGLCDPRAPTPPPCHTATTNGFLFLAAVPAGLPADRWIVDGSAGRRRACLSLRPAGAARRGACPAVPVRGPGPGRDRRHYSSPRAYHAQRKGTNPGPAAQANLYYYYIIE
jgi:hypothetical protein